MLSGALRVEITIQERVETGRDSLNAPIYSWQTFGDGAIWAEVSTRRGVERFDEPASQRYSEVIHQFKVRHFEVEGIDSTMRISFESQTYQITSVLPDRQRREWVLIEAFLQDGEV